MNTILRVINEMNKTFEYYFEEYNEISSSDIWWYYHTTSQKWIHITNLYQKEGDLAIHYYKYGYCALYTHLLKELFQEGKIFWDCTKNHMYFYYEGNIYDASGIIQDPPQNMIEIQLPIPFQEFSKYGNINSEANMNLLNLMKQKGLEILNDFPRKKSDHH